jgi:hypothetical protein
MKLKRYSSESSDTLKGDYLIKKTEEKSDVFFSMKSFVDDLLI